MTWFKQILSYLIPLKLRQYHSEYSGNLFIYMINGRKVLDTDSVNYSFNSLHKVFKTAFIKGKLRSEKNKQSLVLGLGGGSILHILRNDYLIQTPIDVVELDPVIIEIATKEFEINKYSPLEIFKMDAYGFMGTNQKKYDLICVDLFINAEVPSPFLTTPFVERLIESTLKNGQIYFNIMLTNIGIRSSFDTIYKYLLELKGNGISSARYLEIEENNRVLIIEK